MRRTSFVVMLLAIASACSQDPPAETGASAASSNFITGQEIEQSQATSAYDAIVKLRGNFLSNRGKTTILGKETPLPNVYMDGLQVGGVETLRNISAKQLGSIRLYRAWESGKFGSGNSGGVIELTSRTQ
jgi:outer membrane cobalamin receptor